LTVWSARTNSLWTVPLMSKKMMSMLLTLLFVCVTFFGLGEFGLSVYGSCFLHWTLVQSLPGPPSHFSRDLHKNLMLFLCWIHRVVRLPGQTVA
jgi:hypothetical protein